MIKRFFEIVNKNGLVSSLVAAALFSCIVYLFNSDFKQLVYSEHLNDNIIDYETGKGFRIYTADSVLISNNLYLLRINIWNRGNEPIFKNDVKEQLQLELDSSATIVNNVSVIETHPKITKANITNDSNRVFIDFDFLEKKNGIQLNVYYTSNKKAEYKFSGYIANSKGLIKNIEPNWLVILCWFLLNGIVIFLIYNYLILRIAQRLSEWFIYIKISNLMGKILVVTICIILFILLIAITIGMTIELFEHFYPSSPFFEWKIFD